MRARSWLASWQAFTDKEEHDLIRKRLACVRGRTLQHRLAETDTHTYPLYDPSCVFAIFRSERPCADASLPATHPDVTTQHASSWPQHASHISTCAHLSRSLHVQAASLVVARLRLRGYGVSNF